MDTATAPGPADTTDAQVISCAIFNPRTSLFKQFRNDRATCKTITCTLVSCPLRDVGTCTWVSPIGWNACPYGHRRTEEGYTPRARAFSKWISERQEEHKGVSALRWPAVKLAFIGDYAYLPYAHMDMNKAMPFLAHSGVFRKGNCFLPSEHWTGETVCKLIDFRPRAMAGGEITSYRQEEVPKFLLHLRETDAAMWEALIAERPTLDTAPNHVGRKAILRTLNSPIEWTTDKSYPVTWRWDGQHVRTMSEHAYASTWGAVELRQVVVQGIPSEDATLVVQDNAWANDATVFVD